MQGMNQVSTEFHVSRKARDFYSFDEWLFSLSGNVVFANSYGARVFAQRMNDKRDLARFPETTVKAWQINALGLIDEILHHVVSLYRQQRNPRLMGQAMDWLMDRLGREAVHQTLRRFADEFPPVAVYRRQVDLDAYLEGHTNGVPNREVVLEEMLMLWLANMNPAFAPFLELFDDATLEKQTAYRQTISALGDFLQTQPPFGPKNQSLLEILREPAIVAPHSLSAQLEYMREVWSPLLGRYFYRLLSSLDLVREEEKWLLLGPSPGPGPTTALEFSELRGMPPEAERYTVDRDWMPNVVMMAKSTYVWLDQLSKRYGRSITRLDQVPDEELDTLARWGFNALWLIGVWQRSAASKRIKQMCGNPEAEASAYSVFDYQIADDLGGEAAFQNLRAKAWQRGIRLAGDMVPNHVGIDGKWLIEHPDWFISLDYSPFPSYTFNGPDLSWDGRVGIFLEDHYYSRSDAAVVFKRLDRWTGSVRYIYHGNDGTRMPWNDTAQLNYLNPAAREAAIQTILNVARQFPIIRFDAAMTLTKKHYQRLWFPEPGSGGDIPTRAEHGLTRARFDAAMPEEFWREVVDRIAREAPDTLLLAEAFWLMEGYFVRTLGMHRVYNSAFMNMLKAEENAKYRTTIKNVLEFDPEILKRFVNFMNNPDEETAVAQFGKDDKYFGVCTMMATMPGLPMFGHGQIEGLTEKYGMEYRRAYWDEHPDDLLIRRHEREIFPLLHRRHLFAEVSDFLLYDFFGAEGGVNEDVFAYSNRAGDERTLVVFHNKYAEAKGWIRTSAAYSVKTGDSGERVLVQKSLSEGLGLPGDDDRFCLFRDHVTGLEYIRRCSELHAKGLYIELGAYKCHVFVDFRAVEDNVWQHYANLATYLNGRGVPSIEEALRETFLQPIQRPFRELTSSSLFRRLTEARLAGGAVEPDVKLMDEAERAAMDLLREAGNFAAVPTDSVAQARAMRAELETILRLPPTTQVPRRTGGRRRKLQDPARSTLAPGVPTTPAQWACLLGWWSVHSLGKLAGQAGFATRSRVWIDEWLLGKLLAGTFQQLGLDEAPAWRTVGLIKLLTTHQEWFVATSTGAPNADYSVLQGLLKDAEVQQFLRVNRYGDVLWFNKEAFEELLWWLRLVAEIALSQQPSKESTAKRRSVRRIAQQLERAAVKSGYQVEELLRLTRVEPAPAGRAGRATNRGTD